MHAQHNFSPLIAGTMTWGIWGRHFNQQEMIELMNHYVEAGINSFDHADIYGDYTTEAEFGNAFSKSEISRSSVQFITKCGIQTLGGLRNNKVKHYNYRKKYIIESVEQSLKNLHTDYVDLLLLHRPSPLMQPEEIASAIEQLKKEGKLLKFGLSNFTPEQTEFIQQAIPVHANQIEFSITHHTPMLDGSLNHLQMKGITPMCWAPLGHVFKQPDEQSIRIIEAINPLTEKYGVNVAAILLSWIMKHPASIIPVIGTTDKSRITELKKSVNITLDDEDWFLIWTASMGKKVP